ncbi:MAG: glyoxylate/hydroxypyruvate reductase A [Hydrogenophaga sp.]|uniref:2-hydroxyacid dehydrogenase n=1 Tax=Hydrogenophaga sp. TaxID=1904254 RepID=UPI0025BE8213|nr:glyoxylate/hydroxypyruvate reductase A [Hydrogenophaga sp.]MBT9551878.1 glyoxylate/hydroxypyruvate reductase A [Hydrogenophaga sp.]
MSAAPTLLLCSETDDLGDLRPAFEQAAAERCPGLRVALWPEVAAGAAEVVALASWFAPLGLPAALPGLRLIASIGAGAEHVLRDPGLPAGVPVTRIVDEQQARGMAEFVLWAALYYHRGLDRVQQQQPRGVWRMPPQRPAAQTRVGVMGLGTMGAEVARCLAGHGFEVHGWSRRGHAIEGVRTWAGDVQLEDFLRPLDIVVSLLPLTEHTRGLCNARWFARLKPGAAFINCGRGEQVVLPDLLEALERGQLGGAVLDVFEHEPLPPVHPLWHTPRLLVTPHMASSVSPEAMARQIVGDTARVLAGLAPVHAVDRARGY